MREIYLPDHPPKRRTRPPEEKVPEPNLPDRQDNLSVEETKTRRRERNSQETPSENRVGETSPLEIS